MSRNKPNAGSLKRLALATMLAIGCSANAGCILLDGFGAVFLDLAEWGGIAPVIPVPAYWSGKIEDKYWEEERYEKAYVLDPIEGENAPIYCLDPPSPDQVMRALPEETAGGFAFLAETARNNVDIIVEPMVDKVGECKFIPMVGPARLHSCHFKCTVYYDKTIRSSWPIPFSHTDATQEVVYIDKSHFIRCAGGLSNALPAAGTEFE